MKRLKAISMKRHYYCYVARCSDGSLYTGYCVDVPEREKRHNAGEGARYTRSRRQIKIVYWEQFDSRTHAMQREAQIKRWSKNKKEFLIQQ